MRQRPSLLQLLCHLIHRSPETSTRPMGTWKIAELRVNEPALGSFQQQTEGDPRVKIKRLKSGKNLENAFIQLGKRLVVISEVVSHICYILQREIGKFQKMPYKSKHPFCTFITKRTHVIPSSIKIKANLKGNGGESKSLRLSIYLKGSFIVTLHCYQFEITSWHHHIHIIQETEFFEENQTGKIKKKLRLYIFFAPISIFVNPLNNTMEILKFVGQLFFLDNANVSAENMCLWNSFSQLYLGDSSPKPLQIDTFYCKMLLQIDYIKICSLEDIIFRGFFP